MRSSVPVALDLVGARSRPGDCRDAPSMDTSRARTAIVALAAAGLVAACASNEPEDGGIRIGDKTLEQFQPNETSEHWLVSIIGAPTSRTEVFGLDEPVSILRYSTIERGGGGLVSLFTGGKQPKTTATIYFVVRSGVVTQFWADREEQATLLGKKEKDTGEKETPAE